LFLPSNYTGKSPQKQLNEQINQGWQERSMFMWFWPKIQKVLWVELSLIQSFGSGLFHFHCELSKLQMARSDGRIQVRNLDFKKVDQY